MTETLCTSGAVKHRAGANASATITTSGGWITELINQSEGEISLMIPANVVGGFSGYPTYTQSFLQKACAVRSAMAVISYDTTGYLNTPEGAFMVNVLWAEWNDIKNELKDATKIKAMGITILT